MIVAVIVVWEREGEEAVRVEFERAWVSGVSFGDGVWREEGGYYLLRLLGLLGRRGLGWTSSWWLAEAGRVFWLTIIARVWLNVKESLRSSEQTVRMVSLDSVLP